MQKERGDVGKVKKTRKVKKPGFKKISILGMGLMGGSVGMAIRKKKLGKVIGVARRKE